MGQGNVRGAPGSGDDVSGVRNTTTTTNRGITSNSTLKSNQHISSHSSYYARSAASSPTPSFLQHGGAKANAPHPPSGKAKSSTPDFHPIHTMHIPEHPPLTARTENGRLLRPQAVKVGGVNHSCYPFQSESATTTAPRTTHATVAAEYNSAAVPSTEAQQQRDGQYLDRTTIRAAEEASTAPLGELECLASGFLSIADYIYVAETVKGLSSLLLSESERAVQLMTAATTSNYGQGNSNNSGRTPPVILPDTNSFHHYDNNNSAPHPPLPRGPEEKVSGIGTLIHNTGLANVTPLPWTLMREILISQGSAAGRSKSESGVSQATLSMRQSTALNHTLGASMQQTDAFLDDNTDHFQSYASSLSGNRSISPDGVTSTQTASPNEMNLVDATNPHAMPQQQRQADPAAAAVWKSSAAQLSATLGSSTNLAKSNTTDGLTDVATTNTQRIQSPMVSYIALPPSSEALAAAALRPLSLDDLIDITSQDEVLNVFLQSMTKKVHGLSKKLRVLPPFAAFRYCIASLFRAIATSYRSGTAELAPTSSRSRGMFSNNNGNDDADAKAANAPGKAVANNNGTGWVHADMVIDLEMDVNEVCAKEARLAALSAVGDDVRRLFDDTKGRLLRALTNFANAMPLGINSRINNNYLMPTEPIPADFIECGLHTSRRTEFFVSMAERVKMLEGRCSFQSPQAMLLGISQLSNLASQMISAFAIGAVMACTTKWRELYEAGTTNTNEIGDVLEKFATEFCKGYDIMCNEAFPTLRKQYPNVFVVSSFVIKDEEGGRPPMVTVAMSVILKLLFLFAGGLGSIRADDRRLMAEAMREEQRQRGSDGYLSTGTKTGAEAPHGSAAVQSFSDGAAAAAAHKVGCDQQQQLGYHRHQLSTSLSGAAIATDRRPATNANGCRDSIKNSCHSQVGSLTRLLQRLEDTSGTMTDDVALSAALHVHSATVLVLLGAMLSNDPLNNQALTTQESVRLAHAVSRLWRVLFQTAGLLPHGTACPKEMAKWLPLFPMYAVDTEAKRVLLQVYAKTANFSPLCIGPIQREEILQSAAGVVLDIVKGCSEARNNSNTNNRTSFMQVRAPRASELIMPAMDLNGTTSTIVTATNANDSTVSRASADATARSRFSTPRSTVHGTDTASHRIIPIFMSGFQKSPAAAVQVLVGLRSGSKLDQGRPSPTLAKELRQDLYDIAARQVTDRFLPAINLVKEMRSIPLPGGIATFHVDKLEDHSASTLMKLQAYEGKLVLMVAWKKSAVAAATRRSSRAGGARVSQVPSTSISSAASVSSLPCPIRAGDEISIRWANPASVMAQVNANGGDVCEGGEVVVPASLPPPQRHSVLTVLRTTSSFQYLVVLDSPNYLSSYCAAARGINVNKADGKPPQDAGATRRWSTSFTASTSKALANRRESTATLHSMGLGYLEGAVSHAPSIADMLLHRLQTPVLIKDEGKICAWANPQFVVKTAAATAATGGVAAPQVLPSTSPPHDNRPLSYLTSEHPQKQLRPPSSISATMTSAAMPHLEQAVAVLLGWLLGQAPGNDVTFALPLPPLAFRILSRAVYLEEAVEEIHLDAADMSLQCPDLSRAELCQHTLEELRRSLQACITSHASPSDGILFSGKPAVACRHYQRLKEQLKEVLVSMAWNGHPTDTVLRSFWAAVLQGLRQTPLVETPIFANCCARTLRDVLCGPYDHPDADFSFKESFILLITLNAPLNAYRNYIHRCVKEVLDEEFSISEKRLLLRFITGHTLRAQPAYTEIIYVDVQHTFTSTNKLDGIDCSTVQLDKPHRLDKTAAAGHVDQNKPVAAPVTRATVDTTLQLLPVGRSWDNTLVIPNYFEALLMGSYREKVLGASYPWLQQRCGSSSNEMIADPARDFVVLEENDFQFAWAGLTPVQQETLKHRFREMLVQRLRAALYAFLVGRDDSMESLWELAGKLGLAATPGVLLGTTTRDGQDGSNHGQTNSIGGGTFMRRHDGTLVFLDNDDLNSNAMDEFKELPFDDDGDFTDDACSESMEGGLDEAKMLLDNSAFGLFGEERSADGRASVKSGGLFRMGFRGSLNSGELEMGTAGQSQQQLCEDSMAIKMGENGYHSAASFCFGDSVDMPPPPPSLPENEVEATAKACGKGEAKAGAEPTDDEDNGEEQSKENDALIDEEMKKLDSAGQKEALLVSASAVRVATTTALASLSDPLMAKVDAEIRELFPDEDFVTM